MRMRSRQPSMARAIAMGGMLAAIAAFAMSPLVVLASGTTRYVSPFGTDTGNCSSAAAPCLTVQYAVGQAAPGDTVRLAPGAYVEQVAIAKSLTLIGAGRDESVISAPSVLVPDGVSNRTYIVEITGGSTIVSMSNLTVAGPGPLGGGSDCTEPNPLSLDKGITVFGGATLNLSFAAVRHVYDRPTSGCQRGDAISIGSACFSCTPDVGHATINGVIVSVYQKNGVAVRGAGSTLKMTHSRVTNLPNPTIASNGIEILNGAVGVISSTTITGNECNVPTVCGPDPFNQTQAAGILFIGAGAGTQVTSSTVSKNDLGVYTDGGIKMSHVNANDNRYVGIFVDTAAVNGMFTFDTAVSTTSGADEYGIITMSGNGNRFSTNTATGNSIFDMDAAITGSDSNVYASNKCSSASPSKAYWHCP
jgi:hypothetical protein